MGRVAAIVVLAAAVLAPACYRPELGACAVRCTAASGCPADETCGGDLFCHAAGEPATCTDPPDAGPVDASTIDATPGHAPVPRLIGNAWYTDYSGTTFESPPEMSKEGFSISTAGIHDGDLVIFVASIDNGGPTTWPAPLAPGFQQLAQQYFGGDGQTFVVAWKIADHEPAVYAGAYGTSGGSGSSVISIIAITGASPVKPIDTSYVSLQTSAASSPVVCESPGVTTTVDDALVLFVGGSDWSNLTGSNTFTLPDGFTSLVQLGDRGNNMWDWSSHEIGYAIQAQAGATGPLVGSLAGTQTGQGYSVVVAIAPAPAAGE
jgi:hypothetical protein